MRQMTPESEAFLNALVPPAGSDVTDHTQAIYDLIEPLHAVLDRIDDHLNALDRLRRAADRAESDPLVWGWFERFKQNIDGGKQLNRNAIKSLESLCNLGFQMDRYAIKMRETLEKKEVTILDREMVTMPRDDHEALVKAHDKAHRELSAALNQIELLRGRK